MRVGAVATPLALVVAVAVANPPTVALAPDAGAVNVTVTPLTGLLFASLTVACSGIVNALLTVALCGVPAVATMLAGGAVVLVKAKLAGVDTPVMLAFTV